jgi:hypothetical protein
MGYLSQQSSRAPLLINEVGMVRQLKLFEDYSRKDAHDVFDPEASFTKGAGLWGMQGIIPLPGRPNDFVLFVSYGRSQGEHEFDEGISADGLLRWQSQPGQALDNPQIKQFVAHDEAKNSIHLFLRTRIREGGEQLPYTYLGRLKYLGHDGERQQPVHFLWQLLDWPMPDDARARMRLNLDGTEPPIPSPQAAPIIKPQGLLLPEAAPKQREGNPEPTRKFRGVQRRYPSDAENKALGLLGEKLVVENERAALRKLGLEDLAELVKHTAIEEGDGAGYDIRSYFADGRIKYIEVKTTAGPKTADFFISPNEVAFSAAKADEYELRRLYDYDRASNSARYYSIFGDLESQLQLLPTQYRVARLSE